MSFIEVTGLRKVYRLGQEKVYALKNINLKIEKGEICCILGTSGSGKSTLLNMLAGLEKPTRGDIIINGVNIAKLSERKLAKFRQENTGFIFQSYNLIPQLSSLENVGMPLMFKGWSRRKRDKEAKKMLIAVGLKSRMKHRPNQMSGGQQQRVGVARALVVEPEIIFADEPTGNLDSNTSVEVMNLMKRVVREKNQTLVMVTHDNYLAGFADVIIRIRDGKILEVEDHSGEEMPDEIVAQTETAEHL